MHNDQGMRTPDCLFVGYQKSGTTFIRNFMTQHPDVQWTREGGFFLSDGFCREDAGVYLNQFDDIPAPDIRWVDMLESLAIGPIPQDEERWVEERLIPGIPIDDEIVMPAPGLVAENIRTMLGKVKILIIIRNQLTWLRSNYFHYYDYLPDGKKDFLNFLNTLMGKALLSAGMYDHVIAKYHSLFGKNRVHVVTLEEVHQSRQQSLDRVCDFLKMDRVDFVPDSGARNAGRKEVPGPFLRTVASMPGFRYFRAIKRCLPCHAALTSRGRIDEPIAEPVRKTLKAFYSASNFRTSAMLDLDLSELGYPV